MKSIYKAGFKYISNIFVVKERELEIGSPTNVKHVAHIGWDGQAGSAPSWMNHFSTGPDFATTSIGNTGSALSPWSSQDFGECFGRQTTEEIYEDVAPRDLPDIPKAKQKRKKSKSTSSTTMLGGSCSSRSSRSAKSKAKFVEDNNPKPTMNIEVV